jgi:hypothetical protein
VLARLSRRDITPARQQGSIQGRPCLAGLRRGWAHVLEVLPASEEQLRLGLQFSVCYLAVMFLQIVPSASSALQGRPVWAVRPAGRRRCVVLLPAF